ncbi:Polyketide synthase module (plasmid) [Legionella adelaidensis]|uniref:Polyketide synthase module n=1 Tax=Legionella adelaidensis TaxID=45056 RepID=A0A0W0R1U2_9GAMM|nr:type I polyketide synthase [Legionella adelaidensis]KTC65055.1 Polyketide synthase module [Legionella adelaidensis]VEH85426.1 Polyketide synthase module [Legionella adelaidensis]
MAGPKKHLFADTVKKLFEEQASKYPTALALRDSNTEYSYLELNEKANQVAHYLKGESVEKGDFVALLLEPGSEFILFIIAIIKLDAVYIPIDTHAPKSRLKDILQDANPSLLITNESFERQLAGIETQILLPRVIFQESKTFQKNNLNSDISTMDPVNMIYTSGSTGRPKGVIIPHQAVINIAFTENTIQIGPGEKMAQFSSVAFDGSTYEIWTSLLNGATLCIIPSDAKFNHTKFRKILLEFEIAYLFLPTSYLHQLIISAPHTLDTIHTILFGGEQISVDLITKFIHYRKTLKRDITLINGYGPTETTCYVIRQVIDTRHSYDNLYLESIGRPVANTKAYILDEELNEVPEGELYISGANLALGYHNCDLQNNEKFILNPFSNIPSHTKLYKTGDKVTLLSSGDLLYLGRYDDQVKIGGFRIHLNEIESALIQHPQISMASVNVELTGDHHKTLTAYLIFSKTNTIIKAEEIRDFIKQILPVYMLPAKYVKVEKFPLTLIGKVDKSKLEKIPHIDLSIHIDSSSESTIEEKIKEVWKRLLNRTVIDTNKNLFELGANSLLIAEACTRINNEIESEIHIGDILAHPTIHKLSRYIEGDAVFVTPKQRRKEYNTDIAIVGMACRFPGTHSVEEYWENLCEGRESLTRFSQDVLQDENSNYVPVKGILSDIEYFDAHFFGFNPMEASLADPQQRLLLECSWHALEHANIAPSKVSDKTISVFAGISDSSYLQENILKNKLVSSETDVLHQRISTSTSMLSTQISYRLNLRGRSVNVNTACSTGLIAVDHACQDLIHGYSDVALAGAASIVVPQHKGYLYQAGSIVSPDGHCKPFSDSANGTVFSNGVGVVVLKRLKDAIEDRDTIYAVIKGRGINNDGGEKLGFTAPSTSGQINCIRSALEEAQINAEEIGYLEAHGTATALGDIVEIDALKTAYKEHTIKTQYCALGSVKANIGHTDVVAGIAGLIKTALCLYHKQIPPLLHFKKANPDLALEDSPFFVNKTLSNWNNGIKKRYAGISSFGVGGTNAHMILSEYDNHFSEISPAKDEILIISAKSEQALKEHAYNLANYLSKAKGSASNLGNIAYSLQVGREDFPWRTFAVGNNIDSLIRGFQQRKPVFFEESTQHSIVFMFPGQGSQYFKMAMELYDAIPSFAAYLDKGFSIAKSCLNRDLLDIICDPSQEEIHLTQYSQPSLFIIEYALSKLLIDYGIKPNALIGHSLGEYVAACLAEVFTFEEGITLICKRGLLMSLAPKGAMLAIECAEEDVIHFKKTMSIELALHNAPSHCVVSGDIESIKSLEKHLIACKKSYQRLQVSHAFHSRFMEEIKDSFLELLSKIPLSAPSIPIISNVTGDWLPSEKAMDPNYWYAHLRQTVKLCDGFKTILKDKHPIFIEVGLGHSLSNFIKNIITFYGFNNKPYVGNALPNRNKGSSDLYQLFTILGALWEQGLPIQWEKIHNTQPARTPLPPYPFQRQKYWIEPDTFKQNDNKLYKQAWFQKPSYEDHLSSELIQSHSWIIFKEPSDISTTLIEVLTQYGAHIIIVELGDSYESLPENHYKINPEEKDHYFKLIDSIKDNIKAPYFVHLFSLTANQSQFLEPTVINNFLALGFYSLLYLSQAFLEALGDNCPLKGLVLTKGTQRITGMELSIPVNACIHGACQVISKEYPSLEFRSIDLEMSKASSPTSISFLVKYLTDSWGTYYTGIALRNNICWKLTYQPITDSSEKNPFKDGGVYLITGGIGDMALSLCGTIAMHAKNPKLILLSRSPVIEEETWGEIIKEAEHPYYQKILSLQKLKNAGALIYWHQIDITLSEAVESIVEYYKQKFGLINGLLHTAGTAGGGIIPLKTKAMTEQIFLPKIHGTYSLAKAFKNHQLDFVVLMSSLVSLLGEPGQIDYAAANAGLNAFAITELFQSNKVISINWNTWKDLGMAVKNINAISFINRGNDISSAQGQELFFKILKSGYSHVVVSNYDLEEHELVLKQFQENKLSSITKTSRNLFSVTNDYSAPQNTEEKQLATIWQNVLGIEAIGIDDDFFSMGGHSLNALQAIDKTNRLFKSSLSVQQLYKHPTIRAFSLLLNKHKTESVDIIVPLKPQNSNPPFLFVCHPASGMIYCFNTLCSQLSHPISVFGMQDPSITGGELLFDSIHEMAETYLASIKKIQPKGPYYLMGYSFGGNLVYEMAKLLRDENEKIQLLALIDSWCIFSKDHKDELRFKTLFQKTNQHFSDQLISLAWDRMQLLMDHVPSSMNQEMILFKATELMDEYKTIDHPTNGWSRYNKGLITCHTINATHETILNDINSSYILDILNKKGVFES